MGEPGYNLSRSLRPKTRERPDRHLLIVLSLGVILNTLTIATPVLAQCQIDKLTASNAAQGDWFGKSVSINADEVLVGAPLDDDGGTQSGSAFFFRREGAVWVEVEQLTASDAAPGDSFGGSVSIHGDFAVIGAGADDDACPENPICDSGSVYVLRREGLNWVEEAKLIADDAAEKDVFGGAVSLNGNRVVIGATYDDDAGEDSGSAYVFRRDAATWIQEAKLTATDAAPGDRFGLSVSISEDDAVVGAFWNDGACPANPDCNSGAAYVFRRNGTTWVEESKLVGTDTIQGDNFGTSVSIAGDYIVVGARYHNDDVGSAYVFRRTDGGWIQEAKLTPSDPAGVVTFGISVYTDGAHAVVGAMTYGAGSGSAYIFRRGGATWGGGAKVTPPNPVPQFGHAVALHGQVAVVGAPGDAHTGTFAGSVYAYDMPACGVVPAVSGWGLAAMTLLVLAAGTVLLRQRRAAAA